ncbi:fumarylacetoacetate hydrolase family protein [Piscinibacter defluvii]|uniref:fumarylacetoacetate hydrolase family protein n=1 Tax=Piscinibacter defluvii TaxID=1796922 RepID=UPI000FDE01FA|nr:fumarylacetoacetate hydrolase family protein [Piscinibacter defluvii]
MSSIEETVRALVQAHRSGATVSAVTPPDAEAAYAVQERVARELGWFGDAPARHWKSGGPARHLPLTHAPLPPRGVWPSGHDARAWPFHWRGIEAEIALRLGREVDAALAQRLEPATATALVDALCVSIEVVDSRWTEAREASALARLADLQSHGALVLGAWQPFAPHDWAAQVCQVRIGAAEHRFVGTHSLADPAFVLPDWLRHATRDGRTLPAGSVVTTGTWCGLLFANAGDAVHVGFDGIGHADLQL